MSPDTARESGCRVTQASAVLLTARGRGAIATCQFRGDAALFDADPPLFRAANVRPVAEQPINRICFGRWGIEAREEVVLCRVDDATTEVHCHGGTAAVQRILDDLRARGCRIESWQAALRSTMGLMDAECTEALMQATTLRTARILLELQQGLLRTTIEQLIDAPGDVARVGISELLRWADFGLHLTQPWKVVLCGRPNVGKSSLINALVGYSRSIVFDQPGTTRDVVTAETAIDGWPVEFSDTAGLRDAADELESAGVERARRKLAQADLRIVVLDIGRPPTDSDFHLLEEWPDALVIAHKCDLPNEWQSRIPPHAIAASALTGTGIDFLTERIGKVLVPECPAPGTPVPACERQITEIRRASERLSAGDLAAFRGQLQRCLDG